MKGKSTPLKYFESPIQGKEFYAITYITNNFARELQSYTFCKGFCPSKL